MDNFHLIVKGENVIFRPILAMMAKAKKKAAPKKSRADKYDEKLAIKGTFADVFKVVKNNKEDKQAKKETN